MRCYECLVIDMENLDKDVDYQLVIKDISDIFRNAFEPITLLPYIHNIFILSELSSCLKYLN